MSINEQLKAICKTAHNSYQWLDTGFAELNSLLKTDFSSGGWPLGTTTEIGIAEPGIGELRLFLPALRELIKKNTASANVILINPPYEPYAQALKKTQLDPASLIIVNTKNKVDSLWAAEQALSAKCCAAVLTWTNNHPLNQTEARRLQLAAQKSATLNVLFRDRKYLEQSSLFRLRIGLTPRHNTQLEVNITKQPLSWGGQQCVLSLSPHYEHWQRLHVTALPVSQNLLQAKPVQLKVLAKAKHSNKILAFAEKRIRLPKVS